MKSKPANVLLTLTVLSSCFLAGIAGATDASDGYISVPKPVLDKNGNPLVIDYSAVYAEVYKIQQAREKESEQARIGTIINQAGNICLDAAGSNGDSGANVALWGCDNRDDQVWKLPPDGQWGVIKNQAQDLCLDVAGIQGAPGDNVALYTCDGYDDQLWKLMLDGRLLNKAHNYCLDVAGSNGNAGANVMLWSCDGYNDQQWKKVKNS